MKKTLTILFALLALNVTMLYGSENYGFEYPMKAGDAKWNSFHSTFERNQFLQIPDEILKTISTDGLLEICLNYPFLIEATFYSSQDNGLRYLQSHFNGFRELLLRKDLPQALIQKELSFLQEMRRLYVASDNDKGHFSYQDVIMEMLLTNKDVLSMFQKEDIAELSKVVDRYAELKMSYPNIFGYRNLQLYHSSQESHKEDKNVTRWSYPTFSSITIYTPNGSLVPNAQKLEGSDIPALTSSQRNYLINYLYANYDGAILDDEPTYQYNTEGWAWHTSRTGEKVHIDRDNQAYDSIYVHDQSYIRVPEKYADVVVYGDFYFSATKEDSLWYISKWGEGGPRVKHKLTALPNGSDGYFLNANYFPNAIKKYYKLNPHCQISGDRQICSQGVYSLTNLPANATIQWSCDPQNAGTISATGNNSILFTADSFYSGDATLKAKVYLDSMKIATVNNRISVGIPEVMNFNFMSANGNLGQWTANSGDNHLVVELCNDYSASCSYDYRIYRINNDYSVGSLVEQSSNVSPELRSFGPYPAGWYLVELLSYNNCGYYNWIGVEVECVDDNDLRNMAREQDNDIVIESISADYINVSFVNNSSNLGNKPFSTSSERYVVQLWNSNNLIKTSNQVGESFKLSIAGLPKGVYMIKIIRKDVSYSKKFLIR